MRNVYAELAAGTITREQWDKAADMAHALWNRHGFPRVKSKYSPDMVIPADLNREFDKLHRFYLLTEA